MDKVPEQYLHLPEVGPNYQYLWSNGATIPQLSNLDAGVYNLTVTDAHGCTKSGGVTIKEGNPITINTTATPVSCYGGNNGRATAFAFGGKGSLQYNWSNGVTGAQNNNLKAGSYWIYITDANNCVESKLVEITQPPAIILNMSSTPEVLGVWTEQPLLFLPAAHRDILISGIPEALNRILKT
jgi:hypothetical protein